MGPSINGITVNGRAFQAGATYNELLLLEMSVQPTKQDVVTLMKDGSPVAPTTQKEGYLMYILEEPGTFVVKDGNKTFSTFAIGQIVAPIAFPCDQSTIIGTTSKTDLDDVLDGQTVTIPASPTVCYFLPYKCTAQYPNAKLIFSGGAEEFVRDNYVLHNCVMVDYDITTVPGVEIHIMRMIVTVSNRNEVAWIEDVNGKMCSIFNYTTE